MAAMLNSHRTGVPSRKSNEKFNIVFHNAASLHYLAEDVTSFLKNVHGCTNTLAEAVLCDLSEDWCLAGFKCLGLLDKCVTAPLWRVLEDKNVKIHQMGEIYTDLVHFLQASADDDEILSVGLFCGNGPPSLLSYIETDTILKCLTTEDRFDEKARLIMKQLLQQWVSLLERILSPYLPGGEFHSMDAEQISQTKSVVKHNKLAEELFGQLDRLMGKRPELRQC